MDFDNIGVGVKSDEWEFLMEWAQPTWTMQQAENSSMFFIIE